MHRACLWLVLLWTSVPCFADYSTHVKVPALLNQLVAEERFTDKELEGVKAALREAEKLPQLVQAEQTAAERTETWTTYAAKRVDAPRIARGAEFIAQYREMLMRAESEYGVPPSVIAGVLGLETNFGSFTGTTRVLDALATQGMDHPTRSKFFFSELVAFFAFCRDFGMDPTEPKGSYAGAMGWAQFMPSNYRRLAVDFDGDGKRDLWQPADAIGSVARYLVDYDPARRWHRGEPLMVPAKLLQPLAADVAVNTSRSTHRAGSLATLGLESAVDLPPETRVGIVRLQLDQGEEYWLGLHNFYSVMSYNPRVYYAMTVSLLAREMARLDAERGAAGE